MLEQALGSEAKGLGDQELLALADGNSCPGPPLQVDLVLLLGRKLCYEEL